MAPPIAAGSRPAGISVPPDIDGRSFMQVNETWARVSAEEIAARFRRALG